MAKVPQKKVFSIERSRGQGKAGAAGASAPRNGKAPAAGTTDRHDELMTALGQIRDALSAIGKVSGGAGAAGGVDIPVPAMSAELLEQYRQEMEASTSLKMEIKELSTAIEKTKREIATLRTGGGDEVPIDAATTQLDAVVQATELATNTILSNVEEVETIAVRLYENARDDEDRELAEDIKLHVIRIMEACNFQDITGQRITKVVRTMKFVDDRISRMLEIWGEDLAGEAGMDETRDEADKALLNGPQLDDQKVTQAEIDAMFE